MLSIGECGGCGEVCWGVGGDIGKGVGECRGMCGKVCWGLGEVRGDVGGSVLGFGGR